jgi:hypothetical protein
MNCSRHWRSGGKYFTSLNDAVEGADAVKPLGDLIDSKAEIRTLRGTPDEEFTKWLNQILLAVICGALCLEWLFRRLVKLA